MLRISRRIAIPLAVFLFASKGLHAQNRLISSVTTLSFAEGIGYSAPADQEIAITSQGAALSFQIQPTVSTPAGRTWLSVSSLTATTPANLRVSVNPSGLSAGAYYGKLTVYTSLSSVSPISILVILNVDHVYPAVSSSSLTYCALAGNPTPLSRSVTVTSPVGSSGVSAAVGFTVSTKPSNAEGWLSVNITQGVTPLVLNVIADPSNLAAGYYSGSLTLRFDGIQDPILIDVSLNVALSSSPL